MDIKDILTGLTICIICIGALSTISGILISIDDHTKYGCQRSNTPWILTGVGTSLLILVFVCLGNY